MQGGVTHRADASWVESGVSMTGISFAEVFIPDSCLTCQYCFPGFFYGSVSLIMSGMKKLIASYIEVATGAGPTPVLSADGSRRTIIASCFTGIAWTLWPGLDTTLAGITIPPNTAALHLTYAEIGDLLCAPWTANTFGSNNIRLLVAREVDVPDPEPAMILEPPVTFPRRVRRR